MKSRILSFIVILCMGTISLMHSPSPDVPDVGTDQLEAVASQETLPEAFVLSHETMPEAVDYVAMIPHEKAVGEIKTVYTIHSPLEDLPLLMDWETPLRYTDKFIDPGSCSLAEGDLRAI